MAGTAISGKGGTVLAESVDLTEVVKWSLDPSVSVAKYNSNKTNGHKRGVAGVADTNGTIEVKVGENGLELRPGQEVGLVLKFTKTKVAYTIEKAIIAGAPIEVDIDGGEVISATYNFEASDLDGVGTDAGPTTTSSTSTTTT